MKYKYTSNKPKQVKTICIKPELYDLAKSTAEKSVLLTMLRFSNNGRGECSVSIKHIADVAKVITPTASKAIASLGVFERSKQLKVKGGKISVWKVKDEFKPLIIKRSVKEDYIS